MPPRIIDADDLNFISFIFRSDSRAALYAPHLFGHVLTINFQTRAEMLRGPSPRAGALPLINSDAISL